MKTLAVAPQPFFTPRGTPLSVYYRCAAALEAGLEVDLLTYGEGVDPDLPGLGIYRIPSIPGLRTIPVGPSFTKLALDGVMLLWFIVRLLRKRYDAVWAHEEAVFFARFLKPVFRYRLIYDMHSSLPSQLSDFGFSGSRSLRRIFEWLEGQALRSADAVLTISPALAEYALSIMPDPTRHLLLENTLVDPVRLKRTAEVNEPLALELPPGAPLVLYAGTFEPYQGLELLLDAFVLVSRSDESAHLAVVGGHAGQVTHLRYIADTKGLKERAAIHPRVMPDVARELLGRASVVVSPRISGVNTPLKIYSYLEAGAALVATRIESHVQVLNDQVCWLAEPSAEGLAGSILEALGNPEMRERRGAAARALYREKYGRDRYLEQIARLTELLEA